MTSFEVGIRFFGNSIKPTACNVSLKVFIPLVVNKMLKPLCKTFELLRG